LHRYNPAEAAGAGALTSTMLEDIGSDSGKASVNMKTHALISVILFVLGNTAADANDQVEKENNA
jgi:hypothetical protein